MNNAPPNAVLVTIGLLAVVNAISLVAALLRSRYWRHVAATDDVTGLLTRKALVDALADWQPDRVAALLLVDIDRFSELNEAFGQSIGDQVLVEIARRASAESVPALAARWGGDEFALIVPDVSGRQALGELADVIARKMQEPVVIGDAEICLTVHVAAGGWPEQAIHWNELLRRVDLALRRARNSARSTVVYDPKPDAASVQRLALVGELRQAIKKDELRIRYQPRVRLADGAITGAEALVRWQHPRRGLLQPGAFIPPAEAAGLTGALTRRVLELAIADAAEWQRGGHELNVAVNLSANDLSDVGLATFVEQLLSTSGLRPDLLTLEVTESAFMTDATFGADLLEALSSRGITVSIDDFGTGYSSLARVAAMPAQELKIDRGFVSDLWSAGTAAVVKATIELAHNLGMSVVAEGVETADQYSRLADLGCDEAQGYWLGRPMAPSQFLEEASRWENVPRAGRKTKAREAPVAHEAALLEFADKIIALPAVPSDGRTNRRVAQAAGALRHLTARVGRVPVAIAAVYLVTSVAWPDARVAAAPMTAAAVYMCWRSSTRALGRAIQAWRLLAAASTAYLAADVAQVMHYPQLARALYVCVYVFAGIGLCSFPAAVRRPRRERAKVALDVATITVATAASVWFVVLAPTLAARGTLLHRADLAVYPVGDLVLVFGLATAIMRGLAPALAMSLRWVCAGLGAIVATDLYGGWIGIHGLYAGNALVDLVRLLAITAIALGAMMSSARTSMDELVPLGIRRQRVNWFPYAGVVIAEVLLAAAALNSHLSLYPLGGLLIAAVALMMLVTARQVLGLQDNIALVHRSTALARTDALTGLANRRRLMEEGERLFERCRRSGEPIAALMVDIDYFKLVNDAHGHAVGDAILQHVARLCTDNVRTADLVGRYGGDEIVILLTGADVDTAFEMGQRLNHVANDFMPPDLDFVLMLSIGVADSSSASTLGALLHNADRGLYEAKRAGRNQTAAYREPLYAVETAQ